MKMEPSASEAASCVSDLEEAACVYTAWAAQLLTAAGPAERTLARPPLCQPLQCTLQIVKRARSPDSMLASDVAQLESVVGALKGLAMSGSAAAVRSLSLNEQLVRDAIRELKEAIEEAEEERVRLTHSPCRPVAD